MVEFLQQLGQSTGIADFMNSTWGWPIIESLHFVGLSLLVGMIGLFDLRMLGLGKGIPLSALHKLTPFGIGGYLLNVATGSLFLMTMPDQYVFNPAFQMKLVFMSCAGINVILFYSFAFAQVKATAPQAPVENKAKVMALVSLACWTLVIICGRLITVYRPPAYYWCFWC